MNLDAAPVLTWLADHSLRVAALILVVGAGSLVARKASAQSRLFAWTVVLCLAAAMPVLLAVLPEVPMPSVFRDPVILVPGPASAGAEPYPHTQTGTAVRQSTLALPWLLAIYLVGTGLLAARVFAGTRLTNRVLRRARPVDDPILVAEVQARSFAMRLRRVPKVVQHASVHVPFVCGVLRPSLVLPDAWSSWDAATRQAVLTHELSHIGRRDLWTLRAAALYRAVIWINPLSWWLRRKLETLAERASDEAVLASGVEPTAYAEMLVRFFDAAQRAPGRANWQLAMAQRGGAEARKRVGRVLSAPEGGSVKPGLATRVLVGVGVVLAAVPVIVLTASGPDAVAIQQPALSNRGLENQAALRTHEKVRTVAPSPQQSRRLKVDVMKTVPVTVREAPVTVADVKLVPQEQEQEPEPWRSTRMGTDADVVAPRLTLNVNPKYTADALRAKIQGSIPVEVIVSPEGNVTAVRVIKSLDKLFGLDDEAVKAAWQWKFLPGTYQGQPVALRIKIEMEFRVHR